MNNKEKIFIINNQEDEDGDNIYPGNMVFNNKEKREWKIYRGDNSAHKKTGVVKWPAHHLFVAASASEK